MALAVKYSKEQDLENYQLSGNGQGDEFELMRIRNLRKLLRNLDEELEEEAHSLENDIQPIQILRRGQRVRFGKRVRNPGNSIRWG